MARKNLTFAIMDGPFENARTVTALRLIDLAARRGYDVTVFAYEGAVSLTFAKQAPHPNAVHGRDVSQEDHPLPKDWVAALMEAAQKNGGKLDWNQLWPVRGRTRRGGVYPGGEARRPCRFVEGGRGL